MISSALTVSAVVSTMQVPGEQGRRDLQGLISGEDALAIGKLPHFVVDLGGRVKEDRSLFKLLSLFWVPNVPSKVRRYCLRSARDLDHFASYLAGQTVQSIQVGAGGTSLPQCACVQVGSGQAPRTVSRVCSAPMSV